MICPNCGSPIPASVTAAYADEVVRTRELLVKLRDKAAAFKEKVNRGSLPIGSAEWSALERVLKDVEDF